MENKMTKTQRITLRVVFSLTAILIPTGFVLAYLEQYVWGK
jgi:hypothetical protein